MKIAIMQPYFLPYIGYWQLINSVDVFVVYDNIQYTKKGWFNRNRFLQNGQAKIFSLPLKKDNSYLDVIERFISDEYKREKLISVFKNAYCKAPFYKENFEIIEKIIRNNDQNLFNYTYNSIKELCNYLDIKTEIIVSSSININHDLKGKNKVITICKELKADEYINSIGGVELYDKNEFFNNNIHLEFLKPQKIEYQQFNDVFVENLSIVDVLMFNDKKTIHKILEDYVLN